MDATDIHREEFSALRAEIQFHQINASAIFALDITGLGIGVTAAARLPIALPIVAILSSALWLRYCDHVISTFRIAAYITCRLRPKLSERLGEPVLEWEGYLRRVQDEQPHPLPRLPTDSRRGFSVPSVAFFVPPPILLVVYGIQTAPAPTPAATVVFAVVLLVAAGSWIYATMRAVRSSASLAGIDEIITRSFDGPATP